MSKIVFPDSAAIAVVTSWDGGPSTDRTTLRMLDQYGWLGTFFLSPASIGSDGHLSSDVVKALLKSGHEVGLSGQGYASDPTGFTKSLRVDLVRLAEITGSPIRVFQFDERLDSAPDWATETLRAEGLIAARTTAIAPDNRASALRSAGTLALAPTGRYDEDLNDLRERWDELEETGEGVFHVWGRSGEMGADPHDWLDFECVLGFFGGISNVWYCTIGQLAELLTAN